MAATVLTLRSAVRRAGLFLLIVAGGLLALLLAVGWAQAAGVRGLTRYAIGQAAPPVSDLKDFLIAKGFLEKGNRNDPSVFDVETSRAVRAYQGALGLKSTGALGPATLQALAEGRTGTAARSEGVPSASPMRAVPQAATVAPAPARQPAAMRAGETAPFVLPATGELLDRAAARYRAVTTAGGFAQMPKGTDGEAAVTAWLVARLKAEGYGADLRPILPSTDPALAAALRAWQADHEAVRPSGVLDAPTVRALNKPAGYWLAKIEGSAKRFASAAPWFAKRGATPTVVVNVPATRSQLVGGGAVLDDRAVVVGKPTTRTPDLFSQIPEVILSPTWTVPYSIVVHELARKLVKPGYMEAHRYVIDGRAAATGQKTGDPAAIDFSRRSYSVIQLSGPNNTLGLVKLNIAGGRSVYMHDTNVKQVFRRTNRFASHGCVRVDRPFELAAKILDIGGAPSGAPADPAALEDRARSFPSRAEPGERVKLQRPVPVAWLYLTAAPTADGRVRFYRDVYGRDPSSARPGQAAVGQR